MRDDSRLSRNRRSVLKATGAAGALGITALAGCAGSSGGQSERDSFKLGVVTSLSGDLRFGGQVTKRGYDLWKQTINGEGGIEIDGDSYEVELEYADAKSDPSTGADAASQMIESKDVDAILGPYSSNVTLAAAPIMEQNSIPHITGSAESPRIWEKQFEYTFGTVPTVSIIARDAATEILSLEPQAESVYISGVNEPFSKATAEAMRAAAEEAGVEVLAYDLNPADTDWSSVVTSAKSEDPDLHFHGAHIGSHVNLLKAANGVNYEPNGFYCHYGVNTSSFKEGLGDGAENTFGATVWLPQVERAGGALFESPTAYADASKAAFDEAPDYTQAASTAAGIVYQEAFEQLGSAPPLTAGDQEELIGILEEISVDTFYGPVGFETEGEFYHNNVETSPLAIQLQDDLEPTIVGTGPSAGEARYPISQS